MSKEFGGLYTTEQFVEFVEKKYDVSFFLYLYVYYIRLLFLVLKLILIKYFTILLSKQPLKNGIVSLRLPMWADSRNDNKKIFETFSAGCGIFPETENTGHAPSGL